MWLQTSHVAPLKSNVFVYKVKVLIFDPLTKVVISQISITIPPVKSFARYEVLGKYKVSVVLILISHLLLRISCYDRLAEIMHIEGKGDYVVRQYESRMSGEEKSD